MRLVMQKDRVLLSSSYRDSDERSGFRRVALLLILELPISSAALINRLSLLPAPTI
jgi:hypothetical protein